MKLSYKVATALAVATVSVSTPAIAGGPPELNATELAALQSHQYSVKPNVAFNAVLSTLQTLGYVDVNANRDAGTVTAVTDAKAKTIFNIFWGFGKKKWTQKASLLVEEDGLGSRVRLNMMLSETKSRGIFGTSFTDGKIVRFAEPYQDFFSVLDAEIRNRGGSPNTAAPATASGASGTVELGGGVRLIPAQTGSGYCIEAPAGYVGTGSANRPSVTEGQPLCS
jgi:hypothetical protein